ncbi:MAG: hypothetical protein AB1714_28895 [Acidobacteriota bacterium]
MKGIARMLEAKKFVRLGQVLDRPVIAPLGVTAFSLDPRLPSLDARRRRRVLARLTGPSPRLARIPAKSRALVFGLLIAATAAPSLHSSASSVFEMDTYQDFLKGRASGVSLDLAGTVRLSNAVVEVGKMPEGIVWCIASDQAGNTYVGTGFEGRVVRIKADGSSSTFFDSEETHVTALAFDSSGTLFAATSPNGKIYRLDATGKGEAYAKTDDKYVWAMVFDGAGNLYAATGDQGIVRKINRSKESSVFFSSGETNIVCLAFDASGDLLAGGDTRGAVYRISPAGKALAIWSSDLREVRGILPRGDGSIVAGATEARRETEPALPARMPASPAPRDAGVTPVVTATVIDVEPAVATPAPALGKVQVTEKKPRSLVVRIASDGTTKELWRSEEETLYSLAEGWNGRVVVGTGNKGRLFWVADDGTSGLISEFDGEQCAALARFGKDRILCAVNNRPGVYRLSEAPAREGTYTSDVLDAGRTASWGQARWLLRGGNLSISTRSGNTVPPDVSWSEWSLPLKNAAGEQVPSPTARYLQWKATFTPGAQGGSAELDYVAINYRPQNAPPHIASITLYGPGEVYQKSFSTGEGELQGGDDIDLSRSRRSDATQQPPPVQAGGVTGKKMFVPGLQSIQWTADDPNGDELVYEISIKQLGEKTWRTIKSGYDQTTYVIDSTSLPDDYYRVRIQARDDPENPGGTALASAMESTVFLVDNTPPRISAPVPSGGVLAFTISDAMSPIERIAVSINGGKWQPVLPKDGICDGLEERVEVQKPQTGQLMVIKAIDSRGNFAVQRITP